MEHMSSVRGSSLCYIKLASGETILGALTLGESDTHLIVHCPVSVIELTSDWQANVRLVPWIPELSTLALGFSVSIRKSLIVMQSAVPRDLSIYYHRMIERYRNAAPDQYTNCDISAEQENTNH